MIEYRKQGTRMFFKVENGNVLQVLNKEKLSVVTVFFQHQFIEEETLVDAFPATEQEFTDALSIALERIKGFKV
jgi:hypothetical protein